MNIILTHPIHGAKIATHPDEVKQDEKNGWAQYNPDTPAQVESEEPKAEAEKPKRKYTRKQTDQPVEQPNEVPSFLTSASDECEGPQNGDSRGTDQ